MRTAVAVTAVFSLAALGAAPTFAATLYDNLTTTNAMALATRPDTSRFEIEAGDDFVLNTPMKLTGGSFDGLIVPATAGGTPNASQVVFEIYRVFPLDSNAARSPQVVTRTNSPSDVAFATRDTDSGEASFTSQVLAGSFTALNSVQPGGIFKFPNQTTGGNGAITGQEVRINVDLNTPIELPAGHYFFVPQVEVGNGGNFYWLSASRPISGAGTTPISPDLQAWTRDENLNPDWSRVGTDIVGGVTPPTFNTAFSLQAVVPEPTNVALLIAGLGMLGFGVSRAKRSR